MKINRIQNIDNKPVFAAKISPELEKCLRNFFNTGENRLKNIYRLEEKIKEINDIGYDDYTFKFKKQYVGYGTDYKLFAVKDGMPDDRGIVIVKRSSFKSMVNIFMKMRNRYFRSKLEHNK